jgi:MYXO-CTERM domain-containing protein
MRESNGWLSGAFAVLLLTGCTGAQGEPGFDDENAEFGDLQSKEDSGAGAAFVGKFRSATQEVGFLSYLELHADATFFATYQLGAGKSPQKVAGRYKIIDGKAGGLELALEITNCNVEMNAPKKAYVIAPSKRGASNSVDEISLQQIHATSVGNAQTLSRCTECEFGERVPAGAPKTNEQRYRAKIKWVQVKSSTEWNGTLIDPYVCIGQGGNWGSCTKKNLCTDRAECEMSAYALGCEIPEYSESGTCISHPPEEFGLGALTERGIELSVYDDDWTTDGKLGATTVPFKANQLHYELGAFDNVLKVIFDLEAVDGTGLPVPNTNLPVCRVSSASGTGGTGGSPTTRSPTQVTLASSMNPAPVGTEVTFSATVASKDAQVPTGQVTFKLGADEIGKVDLVDGKAQIKARLAQAGELILAAAYAGDARNEPSLQMMRQTAGAAAPQPSQVSLVASANPAAINVDVVYTATVAGLASGGAAPTGEISFSKDGVALGKAALVDGKASYTLRYSGAGSFAIRAAYAGDASYSPSLKDLTQNVGSSSNPPPPSGGPASCTVTLGVAAPRVPAGERVTMRAHVACSASGAPTGKINFGIDGSLRGESVLDASGDAAYALATSGLSGRLELQAMYLGDAGHQMATSAPVALEIAPSTSGSTSSEQPGPAPRDPVMAGPQAAGCSVATGTPDGSMLLIVLAMLWLARRSRAHAA